MDGREILPPLKNTKDLPINNMLKIALIFGQLLTPVNEK
jgi:hypothetical protein